MFEDTRSGVRCICRTPPASRRILRQSSYNRLVVELHYGFKIRFKNNFIESGKLFSKIGSDHKHIFDFFFQFSLLATNMEHCINARAMFWSHV